MKTQVSPELERKFQKAKSLLMLDHPFFGSSVARRPIVWTDAIPTACMSAAGQISINPDFASPLTVKQLQFLLAHEAMHYMLSHSLRRKHRDPKAWNIAADKVINDTLIDAKVGEFIDGGVTMRDARNYAAEELYDESDQGQDGDGPGGTGSDIGDPVDDDGNPMDDAQQHEQEARAKIETLQAAKVAKAMGKLPAGLERLIEELVAVHTPWHEILERFMVARQKDDFSWANPNRRFIGQGIYIPGQNYAPKMGEVVIGVDTSGSIGQRELGEFNAHVSRILEACGPERTHVVYCDAEVNHVDTYEPDDFPVRLTPHGGGGTEFQPVFDWIDNQGIEPEVVVYLTDGFGPSNFTTSHAAKTVWLTTGATNFSFGTVVEFKPE